MKVFIFLSIAFFILNASDAQNGVSNADVQTTLKKLISVVKNLSFKINTLESGMTNVSKTLESHTRGLNNVNLVLETHRQSILEIKKSLSEHS